LSLDAERKTSRSPRKQAGAKKGVEDGEGSSTMTSRGTRSRENTRRKLIDAAQRVMSEKGVEQTTIADITEAADVGFGSFYNHFSTKEDIVYTIATLRAGEFIGMVRKIMANETDMATALSFNIKAFLSKAVADPIWGWFVIRTQGLMEEIDALFSNEIRNDLKRAVSEADLDIHVETATRITLGALFGVLRPLLEKTMPITAIPETCESLLRLYGVDHDKARQLSTLPLPVYLIEPGNRVAE
jgi:AcrR family transcriptional regulator